MSSINLRNSHLQVQEQNNDDQNQGLHNPLISPEIHSKFFNGSTNAVNHTNTASLKANQVARGGDSKLEHTSQVQELAVDHLEVLANKNHSSIMLKKSLLSSGAHLLNNASNLPLESLKGKRPKDVINAMKSMSLNDHSKTLVMMKDMSGWEKGSVDMRVNLEKGSNESAETLKDKGDEDYSGREDEEDNLPNCSKHGNKKAKYYVASNERDLFCSKCAISFALKGEKITEILTPDERKRKRETEKFLSNLNEAKKDNQIFLEDLNGQGERMEKYFTNLNLRVNSIYDMLEKAIKIQRTHILDSISSTLSDNLKKVSEIQDRAQRSKAQIEKFFTDIEKNFDNIIRDVEMGPFNDIINKYKQKLDSIKSDIQSMRENGTIINLKVDESSSLLKAVEAGRLPSLISLIAGNAKLGPSEPLNEEAAQSNNCEGSSNKRRSLSSDFNNEGMALFKNSQENKPNVKPPLQQHLIRVQSQNIDTKAYRKAYQEKEPEVECLLSGSKKGQAPKECNNSGLMKENSSIAVNKIDQPCTISHAKKESADFSLNLLNQNENISSPHAKQSLSNIYEKIAASRGSSHNNTDVSSIPNMIQKHNEGIIFKNENKNQEIFVNQNRNEGVNCPRQTEEMKKGNEESNAEEAQIYANALRGVQNQQKRLISGFHHQSPRSDENSTELPLFCKNLRESGHFKQPCGVPAQGSCKKTKSSSSKDKDRERSSESVYTSILKNLNGKIAGNQAANPVNALCQNNSAVGNSLNKKSMLLNMVSPQSKRNQSMGQGKFFSNEKAKEQQSKLSEAFSRKQPLIDKENFELLLKGK